ncbi:hypothetical protein E4U14_000913 [Claviceps sp. LM454 group G7]|nr:hypothetical protein E4U14_000913 [Claviceps sp. LM454 group G7]
MDLAEAVEAQREQRLECREEVRVITGVLAESGRARDRGGLEEGGGGGGGSGGGGVAASGWWRPGAVYGEAANGRWIVPDVAAVCSVVSNTNNSTTKQQDADWVSLESGGGGGLEAGERMQDEGQKGFEGNGCKMGLKAKPGLEGKRGGEGGERGVRSTIQANQGKGLRGTGGDGVYLLVAFCLFASRRSTDAREKCSYPRIQHLNKDEQPTRMKLCIEARDAAVGWPSKGGG